MEGGEQIRDLDAILQRSAARHAHLCPKQVLGVRAGTEGLKILGVTPPLVGKEVCIILETDGCFVDGIEVATGAAIGHRTLRIEDYGKIAATFVHIPSKCSVRLSPKPNIRSLSSQYAPSEPDAYQTQLAAYRIIPANKLFTVQLVSLVAPIDWIISLPGLRTTCEQCGEEIINQREIERDGRNLCRACAGQAYYLPVKNYPTD